MTRLQTRSDLLALAATVLLAGCSGGAQAPSSGFANGGDCKYNGLLGSYLGSQCYA
jgi:hypothetical protein